MMKVIVGGWVSCFLVFVVPSYATDDVTYGARRGRIRKISNQLDSLQTMVKNMQKDREQCCSRVSEMNMNIQDLTDKIDDLDSASLKADLNIADGHECDMKVCVDVPTLFDKCLQNIDLNRMSYMNANMWCLRLVLWRFDSLSEYDDDEDLELLQVEDDTPYRGKRSSRFIRRRIAPKNITMPPSGFRIRREYRTLTEDERYRYHEAVKVLYEDGTLECFALVHRNAIKKKGAHGGPAFLPWHRAFLAMWEEALRQVDDSVFLPYWDSSFDNNMEVGPGLSVMWDDDHLGQGYGTVNTGPFANFLTPTNPLMRQIARGRGSLISQNRINNVMSYCRLQEFDHRWENAHNNVHVWVGGTMSRSLAASDPVFYMHHAFIDYQWEKFREHQLDDCENIDPQYDYPPTDDIHHKPDTKMDGMRYLRNKDGIENFWTTNWYNYEDTPSCANNCSNSIDLFCDEAHDLCVSEIRFDLRANRQSQEAQAKVVQEEEEVNAYRSSVPEPEDYCITDPYARGCSVYPPPRTAEDRVRAMVNGEIKMPPAIAEMDSRLNADVRSSEEYPTESEPEFFRGAPDDFNDPRTAENSAYTLLTMAARRKTTEARRYSERLGHV